MKRKDSPVRFALIFLALFGLFYYFNIWFFSLTNSGARHYTPFLAAHFNYIQWLRHLLLAATSGVLKLFGFSAIFNNYQLLVAGRGILVIAYSCLGLGIISFLTAFVIAYPKPLKAKLPVLIIGIAGIELLNIIRFILLVLYGNKRINNIIDHHTLFNIITYVIISVSLYFWIRQDTTAATTHEQN